MINQVISPLNGWTIPVHRYYDGAPSFPRVDDVSRIKGTKNYLMLVSGRSIEDPTNVHEHDEGRNYQTGHDGNPSHPRVVDSQ